MRADWVLVLSWNQGLLVLDFAHFFQWNTKPFSIFIHLRSWDTNPGGVSCDYGITSVWVYRCLEGLLACIIAVAPANG